MPQTLRPNTVRSIGWNGRDSAPRARLQASVVHVAASEPLCMKFKALLRTLLAADTLWSPAACPWPGASGAASTAASCESPADEAASSPVEPAADLCWSIT